MFGLASVTFDGVFQGQRLEVVHVARMHAESPQRHGAQFIGGILRRILDDAVAGFDVMEQEVAVGVNDFIAQGFRHGECSAVDNRSCGRGDDGADVAGGAADLLEYVLARLSGSGCGENCVARRSLRAANELSEVVDIR